MIENIFRNSCANALCVCHKGKGTYSKNVFSDNHKAPSVHVHAAGNPHMVENKFTSNGATSLLVDDEGLGSFDSNLFSNEFT